MPNPYGITLDPSSVRWAVRGLFLPAQASWLSDFVSEILAFPAGKNDDQVDCCSLLGQLASGQAPKVKEEPKRLVIGGPSTVCLEGLWSVQERNHKRASSRIY